jgi:hypothetical protein
MSKVLKVGCSYCLAGEGWPCRARGGELGYSHKARVKLARVAALDEVHSAAVAYAVKVSCYEDGAGEATALLAAKEDAYAVGCVASEIEAAEVTS